MPWTEDKLEELGAEEPVLFDETDGIPFEQVADTQPDVILAAYSGLTQEDYDTLSQIAPVVAYPDKPWTTSAYDMVSLDAAGLGLSAEAEELNADLKKQVEEAMAQYPELEARSLCSPPSVAPAPNPRLVSTPSMTHVRASWKKLDLRPLKL